VLSSAASVYCMYHTCMLHGIKHHGTGLVWWWVAEDVVKIIFESPLPTYDALSTLHVQKFIVCRLQGNLILTV
jgi:hypothetical protein